MNTSQTAGLNDEPVLQTNGLAAVTLSSVWSDGIAIHKDQKHLERFSAYREIDFLPSTIANKLVGMRAGDEAEQRISADELVGEWQACRKIETDVAHFDRNYRRGPDITPRTGRFYPQGVLHGVGGIFKEDITPIRIVNIDQGHLTADPNHPLARHNISIRLHIDEVLPGCDQCGGRCTSSLDELLKYPGFAAALPDGRETDFGDDPANMTRQDEQDDEVFYRKARMVQHLDSHALSEINRLYLELIQENSEVLDLMASYDSHLQDIPMSRLHALGMNADELAANKAANHRSVHNLNEITRLPFDDATLDAIVCTASIEYLIHPHSVLQECLRVLRHDGVLVITFSNRWFPTKAIHVWSELHEFERLGMVTQWLHKAGFGDLHTLSSTGWPRPVDDKYASEMHVADPVYAVWGFKDKVSAG